MKKIIFTLSIFLLLGSFAVEVPQIDSNTVTEDSAYTENENGKSFLFFGKMKRRNSIMNAQKALEKKTNPDTQINMQEVINQSVLDYTTQQTNSMF